VTLKTGLEVRQGHWRRHHSVERIWFLLTFHSNHGPILYRFRDRWRFQSKIAKFSYPSSSQAEGSPWNWVSVHGAQKLATGPNKKFDDIFSRLDTMHQCDGRTDGRTDTGRQQRTRLRIASHCKHKKVSCRKQVAHQRSWSTVEKFALRSVWSPWKIWSLFFTLIGGPKNFFFFWGGDDGAEGLNP